MPEDPQEVGAREDDDHQLEDTIELNQEQGPHDRIRLIAVLPEVVLQLLAVVLLDQLFEFLDIE